MCYEIFFANLLKTTLFSTSQFLSGESEIRSFRIIPRENNTL